MGDWTAVKWLNVTKISLVGYVFFPHVLSLHIGKLWELNIHFFPPPEISWFIGGIASYVFIFSLCMCLYRADENDRVRVRNFMALLFAATAVLFVFLQISAYLYFSNGGKPAGFGAALDIEMIEQVLHSLLYLIFLSLFAYTFWRAPEKAYRLFIGFAIALCVADLLPLPWVLLSIEARSATDAYVYPPQSEYFNLLGMGISDAFIFIAFFCSWCMAKYEWSLRGLRHSMALYLLWIAASRFLYFVRPLKYPADLRVVFEPHIIGHVYAGSAYAQFILTTVLMILAPILTGIVLIKKPRVVWMALVFWFAIWGSWQFMEPLPNSAAYTTQLERHEAYEVERKAKFTEEHPEYGGVESEVVQGGVRDVDNPFRYWSISRNITLYLPFTLLFGFSIYLARRKEGDADGEVVHE